MEMVDVIVKTISTVGFPIAMCILFAWYIVRRDEKEERQLERHKDEITDLTQVIQNNTLTMQKLSDNIELFMNMKDKV